MAIRSGSDSTVTRRNNDFDGLVHGEISSNNRIGLPLLDGPVQTPSGDTFEFDSPAGIEQLASNTNRGQNQVRPPTSADGRNASYALMAQDAYQVADNGDLTPDGYALLGRQGNTNTGLAGTAYYNQETNELVISFRGTEPGVADFNADAQLFLGARNPQIPDALAFTEQMQQLARDRGLAVDDITYTGHSLGGGLATEVAALRSIRHNEHNRAVVFEAPGSQRSLEAELGRPLTRQERADFQSSQVNYRTNTPISGPNNPVSSTAFHTSEVVNLNMERSPSQNLAEEYLRTSPIDWAVYTLEQHDMTRIRQVMSSERGVGLDPEVSANEASQFVDAFNSRIQPSWNPVVQAQNLRLRNTFIPLRTIHGDDVEVRVDDGGNLLFNRPGIFNNEGLPPERFNVDLQDPFNQQQLLERGIIVDPSPQQ